MKIAILLLTLTLNIAACSPEERMPAPAENTGTPDNSVPPASNTLQITINNVPFRAALADNAAAKAFRTMLPMTLEMSEMHGNEKYSYLPGDLPAAVHNPGTIQRGDIMLYGTNCLVLFYETFSTPYAYTRIGTVDDPSGLPAALATGDISVTFEIE